MNSFFLKITACLSMFLDHLSYALPQKQSWLNFIGRIAFPLFAFQITEGYTHTRDFNKYALRLAIFAMISQYPFSLLQSMAGSSQGLNIFFTLFLGLMAIRAYDTLPCRGAVVIGIVLASQIADLIHVDYGRWGVLLIFALYVARDSKLKLTVAMLFMVFLRYGQLIISQGSLSYSAIGVLLSLVFILLYNGKKGPSVKYLLYAFYPVHILLLYLLHTWF